MSDVLGPGGRPIPCDQAVSTAVGEMAVQGRCVLPRGHSGPHGGPLYALWPTGVDAALTRAATILGDTDG